MSKQQDGARKLQALFEGAVKGVVLDTSDEAGIFGQLYDPESLMDSLLTVATTQENVGVPSLPPPVAVHSMEYKNTPFLDLKSTAESSLKKWHQVPLRISNYSSRCVRIRWIDQNYGTRSSHTWNLRPHEQNNDESTSQWVQHCSPGHLFLLSLVKDDGNEVNEEEEEDLFSAYDHDLIVPSLSTETLLAAYRPLRPLPSGNSLSIVIRHEEELESSSPNSLEQPESGADTDTQRNLVVESVTSDSYDALVLAAASLDPCTAGNGDVTTTKLLKTILSNLSKYPHEEKYRKLRQSNPKIQKHICNSGGAVNILSLCGFEYNHVADATNETEAYLVVPTTVSEESTTTSLKETQSQALRLMEILSSRAVQGFVPDLAPPTPWEPSRPIIGSGGGSKNQLWAENQNRRNGFVTPEERWARAERVNRNRRNGRGRRPAPGQAPSSRGNWGR